MDLNEKRLCNANPVETAEKLDGHDFWTKKPCLTLSKNVKIKTKTVLTNLTCFDTRKVQQQNQGGSQQQNNHSRPHIAPAPSVLFNQCLPEELQGKLNLWKIMVKLADDGKEPAVHTLAFQYKQSKIISVHKPSQTREESHPSTNVHHYLHSFPHRHYLCPQRTVPRSSAAQIPQQSLLKNTMLPSFFILFTDWPFSTNSQTPKAISPNPNTAKGKNM